MRKFKVLMPYILLLVVFGVGLASFLYLRSERLEKSIYDLKVGYIPIADASQLFVGDAKAFFASQDLNVELISFAGGAKIIEALSANQLDIAFTGTVPLVQASSRGIPLVAISGGSVQTSNNPYQALVVRYDSDIASPAGLKGQNIATNTYRSIDHALTVKYLQGFGIARDDVSYVEIPFPQMEQTLRSGQVQAASMIEPFLSIAKGNNSVRVIAHHVVAVEPRFEMTTYVTSQRWYRENPDSARRFARAMQDATGWIAGNEAELRSIVTGYTRISPEIAGTMTLPEFGTTLDEDQLRRTAMLLRDLNFIDQEPRYAEILSGLGSD